MKDFALNGLGEDFALQAFVYHFTWRDKCDECVIVWSLFRTNLKISNHWYLDLFDSVSQQLLKCLDD